MKNVWILERWMDRNKYVQMSQEFFQMSEEGIPEAIEVVRRIESKLNDPNFIGEWCGVVGKSNYNNFCWEAAHSIKYVKNVKFRVVKAQIKDDATEWVNYVNPVENEGVLRYLYTRTRYI